MCGHILCSTRLSASDSAVEVAAIPVGFLGAYVHQIDVNYQSHGHPTSCRLVHTCIMRLFVDATAGSQGNQQPLLAATAAPCKKRARGHARTSFPRRTTPTLTFCCCVCECACVCIFLRYFAVNRTFEGGRRGAHCIRESFRGFYVCVHL